MENTLINNVSDTALWIAAFRAQESERSDAVFKDTLAKKLAGEKGFAIAEATPHKKAMRFAMVVRTSGIDRLVNSALAQGVDTVINLGAGLDTRPYRMALPASLRWIEVDLPGIIAYKNEQLLYERAACNLERIVVDLSDDAERDQLFARLGVNTAKALIITEGVIAYLTNEQAEKLARSIYSIPSFHFWIMDYSQGKMRKHRRAKNLKKMLVNAPLKFSDKSPIQFFERTGWRVHENIFILDEAKRIGRKLPIMFPWNLLLRMFKKIRNIANKTYGYVMFSRA